MTGLGVLTRVTEPELLFTTATSGRPSPEKSAVATQVGRSPTTNVLCGLNVPVPVPDNSERVSAKSLAATMSSFPSWLKSATALPIGLDSTRYLVMVPNPPNPSFSQTRTADPPPPGGMNDVHARSGCPSPLKSPTLAESGVPASSDVGAPNAPFPLPSTTVTFEVLTTARSGSVSPLKSATAMWFTPPPAVTGVAAPNVPFPFPSRTLNPLL